MTAEQTQSAEPAKASDQPIVHTPGPWRVGETATSIGESIDPGTLAVMADEKQEGARGNVAVVCLVSPPRFTTDVDRKNAQMIAASPDMFRACLMLAEWDNWGGDAPQMLDEAVEAAKEAIIKACG